MQNAMFQELGVFFFPINWRDISNIIDILLTVFCDKSFGFFSSVPNQMCFRHFAKLV
jgi:hypothetical protein